MMTIPETLIDAATLAALPAGAVRVVDCRFDLADREAGARAYRAGHIPGAVYANLDRDLSDLSRTAQGLGRHPLPSAAAFRATLQRWGWRPGLPVVAYDGHAGAIGAARLWWMLRSIGQPAAVLDGGWQAWVAAGLPQAIGDAPDAIGVDAAAASDQDFDAAASVDTEALRRHLTAGSVALIDARAPERYRGEVEPIDRVGGHIPGAGNRPYVQNLQSDGRFKPAAQLRAEWLAVLGAATPASVVHSCGSGVSACHNLLAMEHAGLRGSRLYAPSWSGWISDPARPVAKG
jgi:thiosulfate/3-mercaptopyruvate sulfurtransferase